MGEREGKGELIAGRWYYLLLHLLHFHAVSVPLQNSLPPCFQTFHPLNFLPTPAVAAPTVSIGGGGKGGGRISGSFPFSLEVSLQDNSVSIVSAGSFWLVRCRQPTPSFLRFFSNQLPFDFPHSELWQDEDFLQSGNDASQFSLVLAPISERK